MTEGSRVMSRWQQVCTVRPLQIPLIFVHSGLLQRQNIPDSTTNSPAAAQQNFLRLCWAIHNAFGLWRWGLFVAFSTIRLPSSSGWLVVVPRPRAARPRTATTDSSNSKKRSRPATGSHTSSRKKQRRWRSCALNKHALSSAAKMEIMCLIATIDMSANTNTITGEEVMGD